MAIVVLTKKASKKDIKKATEEYPYYIKITADIRQEIIAIGGEYHADTEKILLEGSQSRQNDLWGGGLDLITGSFDTNAIINLRSGRNESTEILDPETRNRFLEICRRFLKENAK